MGMAASQARYLALVARKSNCEYEGQQINQARLLLSNQSANLFNQMLGLTVPVPPSTQDFTKIQYSYTDGNNYSTIDSWKQLSNDPEYNYIVSSHYFANTYTGSVKKMADPQVQVSSPNGVSTSLGNWPQIEAAYNAMTAAQAVRDSAYNTWQNTKNSQERIINSLRNDAQVHNGYQVFQQGLNQKSAVAPEIGYYKFEFDNTINNFGYSVKIFNPDALVPTAVTDEQALMNSSKAAANAADATAQAATTFADAQAAAIETANNAIAAAQSALAIANLSGDPTAISTAQTELANAQQALIDAQSISDLNDEISTSVTDTVNANAIAQGATDPLEAKAAAIEAADNAVIAAQAAYDIAFLSGDTTAITNAQTQLSNAQAAQAAANAATTLTQAQTAAQDAENAATAAQSIITSAIMIDAAKAASTAANSAANAAVAAITTAVVTGAENNFSTVITDANSILKAVKYQIDLGISTIDGVNTAILDYNTSHGITTTEYISDANDLIDFTNVPPYSDLQKEVLRVFGLSVESESGTPTGDTHIVLASDVTALDSALPTTAGSTVYTFAGYPLAGADTTNASYLAQINAAQALIDSDYQTYEAAETIYQNALNAYNALNRPTYIGNSELTLLGTLTEDQATELLQVVKDMKAQDIDSHLLDCFADDGSYLGGVYSFKLNGITYYTTFEDLSDAYASNHLSNNLIDAQYKMPYYNATYVQKRIDQTGKALLETDEEGRFSSVRFENDSVTYVLKTETITDDEAYQDAMNQYYYENAIYDKTVQDINAQTSIIQQEDQQLELRLKQLDTEQNALKTEMEAVSKIVKDNVDDTFKTFGG